MGSQPCSLFVLVVEYGVLWQATPNLLRSVVGELNRIALTPSRRLQLAAETSGVPALIIRRSTEHLSESNAAMTRWRISPAPSVETSPHRMGRPLWRVDLLRCRGASPNTWTVEACNAEGRCALPANVPDRSDAAAQERWRSSA